MWHYRDQGMEGVIIMIIRSGRVPVLAALRLAGSFPGRFGLRKHDSSGK